MEKRGGLEAAEYVEEPRRAEAAEHAKERGRAEAAEHVEERERAEGLAYRYLDRRERTVAEVSAHLAQRGVKPAVSEAVIGRLRADGYLDDARYARLFAEDKRRLEQWGADRIRRSLLSRGIARDAVEGALADQAEETELERALAVLRRRFRSPPAERRDRDRALGVLVRKGYEPDLAIDALAAYEREGREGREAHPPAE